MNYSEYEKNEAYWQKKSLKLKIVLLIQVLFGLPKSIIFNFRYFGVEGVKLPVLLSSKVKLKKLKGKVIIRSNYRFGMIKLGFQAPEMYDDRRLSFIWINDGLVEFVGKASMRNGTVVRNYGYLYFGDSFHISAPSRIICYRHIRFGDGVLIGWDCEFTDGDAHKIYSIEDSSLSNRLNVNKEIIIGDRVWIAAHVKILKGVQILSDTVIAEGTTLTKSFDEKNIIIGGNPARVLKRNIIWSV